MRHGVFTQAGVLLAGLLAVQSPSATAAPISPLSYSMPNGDGQAHGGGFNYWDALYTGSGTTTTDGAPLSGGLGKLTDGVVSTQPWHLVSNNAGTGEYVGWFFPNTPNPVVTFQFLGTPTIDSITIQLDNTHFGGVYAPIAILVDGVAQSFTPPAIGDVGSVTLSGLGLTGGSLTIEFQQDLSAWTFVSEISFDGRPSEIPEPMTIALLGLGMAGFAAARGRR